VCLLVVVSDLMQRGYEYWRTEPEGESFAPGFRPQLTPPEMLRLGVFGGRYMTDCRDEFPAGWFEGAKLCHERHDPALNFFGVNASQPLSTWRAKGWIHPDDPRGWFQWYCRYYSGRRHPDDDRQIRRWLGFRRHLAQLRKACAGLGPDCRRRQRQALLHWAYDTRSV
jgi:hypothetical protein